MIDKKLLFNQQPTPRNARAAAEFPDRRYGERGIHLGMVSDLLIDETDVDRYVIGLRDRGVGSTPIAIDEMRLGDPTKYPDLGPYEGFHRHLMRFINFNPASSYAGYLLQGDESLKTRIKMGRTKTPGFIHPPDHVKVILTPGVAGALRMINMALLLPPHQLNPSSELLDELEGKLIQKNMSPDDFEYLLSFVRKLREGVTPDNVIIPRWTYVSHMAETALALADFKLCNLTNSGQVDTEHLKTVIDENTRAVLFATVGNPLTIGMNPEVFDQILHIVQDKSMQYGHPIVVIPDVIYEQYRRDRNARIDAIQRTLKLGIRVPVLEVSSFSKMLAIPGERVGFIRILWDPIFFPTEREAFFKALKNVTGPTLNYVACSVQRALGAMYTSIRSKLPVEEELAPLAAVLTALSDLSESKESPITYGDTKLFLRNKEIRESDPHLKNLRQNLSDMGIEKGYFSAMKVANKTRKIAYQQLKKYDVDLDSEMVLEIGKKLEAAGYIKSITVDEIVFYKCVKKVPKVERSVDGKLTLYQISLNSEWREVAAKCGITTEDASYQAHKKHMRNTAFERVQYFAQGLERLRKKGLGIYLHPGYYDENGELDNNSFNGFYVVWGFIKLGTYSPDGLSQARVLAEKCVEMGRPIIACVPGESFLPSEVRISEPSYIRSVALLTEKNIDSVLQTIEMVASELDNGT